MRTNRPEFVNVIGSGYAGIECALFLAGHGIQVHLFDDNRDYNFEELNHKFESNSTKKRKIFEKVLFKELQLFGSPLARVEFKDDEFLSSKHCKEMLERGKQLLQSSPNIRIFPTIMQELNPNEITVVATGYCTDAKLLNSLSYYLGNMNCFDKILVYPKFVGIDETQFVKVESTKERLYFPMNYQEYINFINVIVDAINDERENDNQYFIENTIEWLVAKGKDCLKNYAMRPIYIPGLTERPYAVLKMKKTDRGIRICDFGSKLSEESQLKIFKSIKGFENAVLIKKADVTNSCLVNSKFVINEFNQSVQNENIFLAGSLLGISGVLDSMATGMVTGLCINKFFNDYQMIAPPKYSCLGAIDNRILSSNEIKPEIYAEDYGIIDEGFDLDDENIVDKLYARSLENLEKFKENYRYGKHV